MKLFRKKGKENVCKKTAFVKTEVEIDRTNIYAKDDCFLRAEKMLKIAGIRPRNIGLEAQLARAILGYQDIDAFNGNEVDNVCVVRASSLKNGQYFHNGDGKFSPISNFKIDNSQVTLTDATGESFLFYLNELVIIQEPRESK